MIAYQGYLVLVLGLYWLCVELLLFWPSIFACPLSTEQLEINLFQQSHTHHNQHERKCFLHIERKLGVRTSLMLVVVCV